MPYLTKRPTPRRLQTFAIDRRSLAVRAFALAALLLVSLLMAGRARAEINSDLLAKVTKCQTDLQEAFKESFKARDDWNDKDARCNLNRAIGGKGAKNNFYFKANIRNLRDTAHSIKNTHGEVPDVSFDDHDGTCELAFQSAHWALDSIAKQRHSICLQTMKKIDGMFECYQDQKIKKCEQEVPRLKTVINDDYNHTVRLSRELKQFLAKSEDNVKEAKKRYDADMMKLMQQPAGALEIGENGRVLSNDEYRPLLVKNPTARATVFQGALKNDADYGEIVQEQIRASKAIETFKKEMAAYLLEQEKFRDALMSSVGKYVPQDVGTDYTRYAAPAATAMGALGSVTGATSAATSALPLAAAAAGAASMATSAGKSSYGGGSDGSGASSGPAAALIENTSTGGGAAKTDAGQVLVAPTAPVTEIISKTEKIENRAPSSDTFIPGKLGGSGSSTNEGKTGGASAAANGVTIAAGGGGGEDLLHSFNDAIKPIPAPSKKKDDGMAGMNDLFGSMTKMFNFDPPPPSTETAPPPADSGSANSAFNDGFQYGSGGGASPSSAASADQAFAGEAENASPEAGEMIQFGSIGTPLFQRVHNRHRVAMEKGWLVQEFGKLPR